MKNYTVEIKWGIRFTLLILAWAIIEKLLGFHDDKISSWYLFSSLFMIPAVLFYFLALKEKKHIYSGNMSWAQGFISSIILSFIIALLNPFTQIVIYKAITPHFFEKIIEYKTANSSMTLKVAQDYFNLKTFIIQGCFTSLSYGTVTGATISLFLKNKK